LGLYQKSVFLEKRNTATVNFSGGEKRRKRENTNKAGHTGGKRSPLVSTNQTTVFREEANTTGRGKIYIINRGEKEERDRKKKLYGSFLLTDHARRGQGEKETQRRKEAAGGGGESSLLGGVKTTVAYGAAGCSWSARESPLKKAGRGTDQKPHDTERGAVFVNAIKFSNQLAALQKKAVMNDKFQR